MKWLTRLKKIECPPESSPTKPTEVSSVGFVGACPALFQNIVGESTSPETRLEALNDPTAIDDVFAARLALFTDRDLSMEEAQAMAEKLVQRDKEKDDRRVCLECAHLWGNAQVRNCSQWRKIGMINGPAIPSELTMLLQRCNGFDTN